MSNHDAYSGMQDEHGHAIITFPIETFTRLVLSRLQKILIFRMSWDKLNRRQSSRAALSIRTGYYTFAGPPSSDGVDAGRLPPPFLPPFVLSFTGGRLSHLVFTISYTLGSAQYPAISTAEWPRKCIVIANTSRE